METQWLPVSLVVWITALAGTLDARRQVRFVALRTGLLFARGRRTVASGLRLWRGADYKRDDYLLGSVGRKALAIAGALLRILLKERAGNNFLIQVGGCGSPDPAVCWTVGLPPGLGLETFGRPGGKVRRPCHNLVLIARTPGSYSRPVPKRLAGDGPGAVGLRHRRLAHPAVRAPRRGRRQASQPHSGTGRVPVPLRPRLGLSGPPGPTPALGSDRPADPRALGHPGQGYRLDGGVLRLGVPHQAGAGRRPD